MLNSTRVDAKYLDTLHMKQKRLEEKMQQREMERQRATETFVEHVKKELEMLVNQKEKMDVRNQQFLKQVNSYTKEFGKFLPELMEAEDRLKQAKIKYLTYLQKQMK